MEEKREKNQTGLIVGSGWKDEVRKAEEKKTYQTVDLSEKVDPDIKADFTRDITRQLPKKQFDVIILERFNADLNANAFKNIAWALKDDGICIIHWTDPLHRTKNIFQNMNQEGIKYFRSAEGNLTEVRGNGMLILSKSEEPLKYGTMMQKLNSYPLAREFLIQDTEREHNNNFIKHTDYSAPKKTELAALDMERNNLYLKMRLINELSNLITREKNHPNSANLVKFLEKVVDAARKNDSSVIVDLKKLIPHLNKELESAIKNMSSYQQQPTRNKLNNLIEEDNSVHQEHREINAQYNKSNEYKIHLEKYLFNKTGELYNKYSTALSENKEEQGFFKKNYKSDLEENIQALNSFNHYLNGRIDFDDIDKKYRQRLLTMPELNVDMLAKNPLRNQLFKQEIPSIKMENK